MYVIDNIITFTFTAGLLSNRADGHTAPDPVTAMFYAQFVNIIVGSGRC
jgi:hypothetical protein